jgi:hypothetical protein
MTLNDFKAVAGDRQMGVRSLPVQLGVDRAARVACWFMAVPQVVVIGLLLHWGQPWHAAGVAAAAGRTRRADAPLPGRPDGPGALVQRLRCAAVRGRHDGQRLRPAGYGMTPFGWGQRGPAGSGAGLRWARRGADHLDAQPRDGGGTGAAGAAAGHAGRAALPGADGPAAHGPRLRRRRSPHALDRRRHGGAGRGRRGGRAGHGLDGDQPACRHRAGGAGLRAGRPGRERQRHLAAGDAGQARARCGRAVPPPWSG